LLSFERVCTIMTNVVLTILCDGLIYTCMHNMYITSSILLFL
jgi:hypothetical protein